MNNLPVSGEQLTGHMMKYLPVTLFSFEKWKGKSFIRAILKRENRLPDK